MDLWFHDWIYESYVNSLSIPELRNHYLKQLQAVRERLNINITEV
jgi:hypothetical protein